MNNVYHDLEKASEIIKSLSNINSKGAITEDKIRFKPVAPIETTDATNSTSLVNQPGINADAGILGSDIDNLTQLAERRDQRYAIYDSMRINDSFAAAALEMYADDITQPDPTGRSIWVESSSEIGGSADIAAAGNRILKLLRVEDNLWATAYALVCYGDVYFEIFRDIYKTTFFSEGKEDKLELTDDQKEVIRAQLNSPILESKLNIYPTPKKYSLEDYIEQVEDPSEIFDLVIHGRTVGYARTHVNEDKQDSEKWNNLFSNRTYRFRRNEIDLYDSQKFVHIYVPDAGTRHQYKLLIDLGSDIESDKQDLGIEYTIPTGKSLLQDAYKVSQQLQLLETSIILSRLAHAAIYRLVSVQVGQKSEVEVASILQRLKSLLDKKQVIDTMSGSLGSYQNPPPQVSNVIIPVKDNGQGAVNTQVIGGDYDPGALTDIDYLVNKELAAFKIPRQFFNFTDGGGFNGGSSLAKISAQYAHRIVRFKRAIIKGFTDLVNIFFRNRYPDYVGKFEIKMTQMNTIEDAERVAMARDKLNMVASIMDQIDAMDDVIGKFKILKDAIEDAYPNSVVSKVLDDYITKLESKQNGRSDVGSDSEEEFDADFSGGDTGEEAFISDSDFSNPIDGAATDGASDFPTSLNDDSGIDYTNTAEVDSILGEQ